MNSALFNLACILSLMAAAWLAGPADIKAHHCNGPQRQCQKW